MQRKFVVVVIGPRLGAASATGWVMKPYPANLLPLFALWDQSQYAVFEQQTLKFLTEEFSLTKIANLQKSSSPDGPNVYPRCFHTLADPIGYRSLWIWFSPTWWSAKRDARQRGRWWDEVIQTPPITMHQLQGGKPLLSTRLVPIYGPSHVKPHEIGPPSPEMGEFLLLAASKCFICWQLW